jgi:hypothetical protein
MSPEKQKYGGFLGNSDGALSAYEDEFEYFNY